MDYWGDQGKEWEKEQEEWLCSSEAKVMRIVASILVIDGTLTFICRARLCQLLVWE